jgi:uncharacterized protein (TIGR02646 family)
MHKLDRSSVPVPECLEVARQEGRSYKQLRPHESREIRTRLLELQQDRCAYCERRTDDRPQHGGHIEHFRQQSAGHCAGDPTLDLCWENLFWSCVDPFTCGKFKDACYRGAGVRRRYDPATLLDPARDDPEDYLVFVHDGTVRVRDDLDEAGRARAEETIRVFQLNDSAYLRKSRQDAVRPYLVIFQAVTTFDLAALAAFVRSELQQSSAAPFATTIKHFLKSVI